MKKKKEDFSAVCSALSPLVSTFTGACTNTLAPLQAIPLKDVF